MCRFISALLLLVVQFIFVPCLSNATRWVLQQNLPMDEDVAHKTLQQEHELLLKHLSRKNKGDMAMDIMLELFTKVTDGDFYAIISGGGDGGGKRAQHNAVVKAVFATFTRIPYRDNIFRLLNSVAREAAVHFQEHKNLEEAMTWAYSKLDTQSRNLTSYYEESFKREYHQNNNVSSTAAATNSSGYKVYHYGIPKNEDELRRILVDLANHPKMKKIALYTTFQFHLTREDIILHQSLTQLASVPGKLDAVQQIFDDTVAEVFPQVNDIGAQDVDLKMPLNINLKHLKPAMVDILVTKIKNNTDLKADFESVQKRVRDLWTH